MDGLKKKLTDKDSLMKLQLDKLSKFEQQIIKLRDEGNKAKEENSKLKTKLKQVTTKLEETKDGAVNLVEVNSKAIVKELKKGLDFNDFLTFMPWASSIWLMTICEGI